MEAEVNLKMLQLLSHSHEYCIYGIYCLLHSFQLHKCIQQRPSTPQPDHSHLWNPTTNNQTRNPLAKLTVHLTNQVPRR